MKVLEARVSDLAGVVEAMSKSFAAFVDHIFDSSSIDPALLKQTMEHFLALSPKS